MKLFKKKELVPATKAPITKESVAQYVKSMMPGSHLTDPEMVAFYTMAHKFGLDPWKKEIHCIPFMANQKMPDGSWKKVRKLSLITGYEVYLKRAERTGQLEWWNTEAGFDEKKKDLIATIHIKRKDREQPLIWSVKLGEFGQDNKMWRRAPEMMLKKVAISQGFRLAFPDELGGMPYTGDELPDDMTKPKERVVNAEIVEEPPEVTESKGEELAEKIKERAEDAEVEVTMNMIAQRITKSGMEPSEKAEYINRASENKGNQAELGRIYAELEGK